MHNMKHEIVRVQRSAVCQWEKKLRDLIYYLVIY